MFQFTSQEEYLPELLDLQKQNSIEKTAAKQADDPYVSKTQENPNQPAQRQTLSWHKQMTMNFKSQDFEKLQKNKLEEMTKKKKQLDMRKKNQASKTLIAEMINKISSKNVTQELYPASNQTINKLLFQLDSQIGELSIQVEKRENSLVMNSNNQHLKKQLQAFEKSLNQIKTIKGLYIEQCDNRNKIAELEARVIDLKSENRDLKIKIARGIDKIQSHIHNLPCEKEKELIQEVNKYRLELTVEKEMRQNLQANIKNIVMNFQRFYVEADNARKIVTERLRQLDSKQSDLKCKMEAINLKNKEKQELDAQNELMRQNEPNLRQNDLNIRQNDRSQHGNSEIRTQTIQNKKNDRKLSEAENNMEYMNISMRKSKPLGQISGLMKTRRANAIKKQQQPEKPVFSLQQQIERMRSNQLNFSRTPNKKL